MPPIFASFSSSIKSYGLIRASGTVLPPFLVDYFVVAGGGGGGNNGRGGGGGKNNDRPRKK